MEGCDKSWAFLLSHFLPGQIAHPRRYPGVQMQDVGLFFAQKAHQLADLEEGAQAFAADGAGDVVCSGCLNAWYHAAAFGDDDAFIAVRTETLAELEYNLLDSAGAQ